MRLRRGRTPHLQGFRSALPHPAAVSAGHNSGGLCLASPAVKVAVVSVVRAALYFSPGRGTLQIISATATPVLITVPGSGNLQRAVSLLISTK